MTTNQGIDLNHRPGVPMEWEPPQMTSRGQASARQEPRFEILHEPSRSELTPVFGTGGRPHGLSGVLRRLAYREPDYRVKRWLLLLIADRVDAQETRLMRLLRLSP
jgi:hypothetical protein